jgi:phosphohistidine phosphatase
MKSIFVVRHSKAEQNFLGNDFARKLTDVGKENTTLVATRFLAKNTLPKLLISSPAKRAKTTAQLFANSFMLDKENIIYKSELYHAPSFVYYDLLKSLPNECNSVMLFAHNPGITDFVNSLSIVQLDNMPTSGIFGFTVETIEWKFFEKSKKAFLFFDHPKQNN